MRTKIWPYECLDRIIREEYPRGGSAGVQEALRAIGYERSISQIRNRVKRLGITKVTIWTEDMVELMRTYYPIVGGKRTYQLLIDQGYQPRSWRAVVQKAMKLGIKSGVNHKSNAGGFKKGHQPWNKGRKLSDNLKQRITHKFQKGHTPANTVPVGTITYRPNANKGRGEYYIKTAHRQYQQYHRWLWEQVYGPIAARHIIYFKDGNHCNVTISNLGMMSQADNARRNNGHHELTDNRVASYLRMKTEQVPQELLEVKRQQIILNRQIQNHEED